MGCSQSKPNNNTLRPANRNFQRQPNTKTPATTNLGENKPTHGNVVPPDTADEPNSVTLQNDTHHRAAAPTETHVYSSSCSSSLHDVSTSHVNTSSDTSSDTSGNTTTHTPAATDEDGDRVRETEPEVSNDSAPVPSDLTSSFIINEDLPLNATEHRASSDIHSISSDAPKPVTFETAETLSINTDKTSNTPFETTSVPPNNDTVTVSPDTNLLSLNNHDVDSLTAEEHSTHAAETDKQTTLSNPNVTQLRSTKEPTTFPEHSSQTQSFETDTSNVVVSDKSSEDAVPALSNKSSSFSVKEAPNNSVPPVQTTNASPEPITALTTTEQTFADSPRPDPTLHDPEPQEAILQNTEPHDLAFPDSEFQDPMPQDPMPQDPTLHTAATTFITAANSITSIQSAEEKTTPTQQSTGGFDSELPNATPNPPTHSDDNMLLLNPYTQSHDDVESLEEDDTVGDDNAPLSWTEVTDQRLARSDNITLLRLRQPTAEHLNSIDEDTPTTPNKTSLYPLSRIRQAPDSPPFCMFEDICSLGPVEAVQNAVRNINSSVFDVCSSLFP